ncbi:MAG: hypothetical protein ACM3MF_06325 [Anaerolineae bacterium]
MSLQNIQRAEQRVRSYWYEDGLAEMATGGVFVAMGAYFALQGYFGEGSSITTILQVGLALLIIFGAYFVRRIVGSLKARFTYPRTGYVEYRVDAGNVQLRRFVTAGLGFLAAAGLIALYRAVHGLDVVVLATGVIVAFILVALRIQARGIRRFYLLGTLSLALGAILSLARLPEAYALGLFYGLFGLVLLVSGGLALRRYLRQNPLPSEA